MRLPAFCVWTTGLFCKEICVEVIVPLPRDRAEPDMKMLRFRVQIKFRGLICRLGIQPAHPLHRPQGFEFRQGEKLRLEGVDLLPKLRSRAYFFIRKPCCPPYFEIIRFVRPSTDNATPEERKYESTIFLLLHFLNVVVLIIAMYFWQSSRLGKSRNTSATKSIKGEMSCQYV